MTDGAEIIGKLPPMKYGDDLKEALEVLPVYDPAIRNAEVPVRLLALSDLYQIHVPDRMSFEIYNKLYLGLIRSLRKKHTRTAIQQHNENLKAVHKQTYAGIVGGSDSFTIIGPSGIGKSSAISRAIEVITEGELIETSGPYARIIPCLCVQCPFDSSVKGMLLEILRKVDEAIGSDYFKSGARPKTTTDMLIGTVSQVALNHIGLLIVDEIQNVCNGKNGRSLVAMLTQLINSSGISICMVGTPESVPFFEQAMQLARRSLGLRYGSLGYDERFRAVCGTLFSYQYVRRETPFSAAFGEWLYEHSAGNVSMLVALVHDAQELAILDGRDVLDMESLNMAYRQRMAMLHSHVRPAADVDSPKTDTRSAARKQRAAGAGCRIADLVTSSRESGVDIVDLLSRHFPVEEVTL